jgi:hypothetical protein
MNPVDQSNHRVWSPGFIPGIGHPAGAMSEHTRDSATPPGDTDPVIDDADAPTTQAVGTVLDAIDAGVLDAETRQRLATALLDDPVNDDRQTRKLQQDANSETSLYCNLTETGATYHGLRAKQLVEVRVVEAGIVILPLSW